MVVLILRMLNNDSKVIHCSYFEANQKANGFPEILNDVINGWLIVTKCLLQRYSSYFLSDEHCVIMSVCLCLISTVLVLKQNRKVTTPSSYNIRIGFSHVRAFVRTSVPEEGQTLADYTMTVPLITTVPSSEVLQFREALRQNRALEDSKGRAAELHCD